MNKVLSRVVFGAVLFTTSCAPPDKASKKVVKSSSSREDRVNNNAPIGTATMAEDGTITLDLRAQSGGTIGHGQLVYRKDDKGYADVLKHLGGLQPGQSKLVPPWPDNH